MESRSLLWEMEKGREKGENERRGLERERNGERGTEGKGKVREEMEK